MINCSFNRPALRPYAIIKSVLDCVGAFILLVLLGPVWLLITLLIRLDSAGPTIYRQKRIGANGSTFTIYKFRTMKLGTPVLSTEEMKNGGYNPYTRIGNFLRKTSLDEVPQLINILRGEMSFIGPRPALPTQTDVNQLRTEMGADCVKPGITGLAQVMGRDDLDTQTKVRYDSLYCRRMSMSFDMSVLFKTFSAVLSAKGNK